MPQEIMNTFIITYNPLKWPEYKIQELINRLNNGDTVIERWKFGSPRKCQIGDRIFLSRVGQDNPGLIGSGVIDSFPHQEKNFENQKKLSWYVDVRFDYLSSTPDTVVVTHRELSSLLKIDKKSFTPHQSGVSFKGNAEELEKVWQSLTENHIFKFAEEISGHEEIFFSEGAKLKITINKYERDQKARNECIKIHGYSCKICNFNFEKTFGLLGNKYIHVHHLTPISEIGENYILNPGKDLVPVCPNCHAMLHKSENPADIEKLKQMLVQGKS